MMGSTLENKVDMKRRMKELQSQVDELKDLVNTLLSVICEEQMVCTQDCTNNTWSTTYQILHVINL